MEVLIGYFENLKIEDWLIEDWFEDKYDKRK